MVDLLLSQPAISVDMRDLSGSTPLHRAVSKGHEGIVKKMIQKGRASPNIQDKEGFTPLVRSQREGTKPTRISCLTPGTPFFDIVLIVVLSLCYLSVSPSQHLAAIESNSNMVVQLMQLGANIKMESQVAGRKERAETRSSGRRTEHNQKITQGRPPFERD